MMQERTKEVGGEPPKEKKTLACDDYTQKQKIAVCVIYGGISITISMCYKTILSSFHFEAEFLLLACQQILGLIFCFFAQRFLGKYEMFSVPKFEWHTFMNSTPVGTLFVLNIGIGFFGLKLTNVPMFLALRRTTTIFTLLFEFCILGHTASSREIVSIVVIIIGTVAAGWHTLQREYLGYLITVFNNVLSALYLNMSRRFGDNFGVKGFGLVYYNSLIAVPLSLLLSLVLGEFEYVANFPDLFKPSFLGSMAFSAVLGITMTYIVMLCASVNSPIVTSVTGNVKDVLATVIGALIFGFDATISNVIGLIISFCGAGLFTYSRFANGGKTAASHANASARFPGGDNEEEDQSSPLLERRG